MISPKVVKPTFLLALLFFTSMVCFAQFLPTGSTGNRPYVTITGTVQGDRAYLTASGSSPQGYTLGYNWTAAAGNPGTASFSSTSGTTTTVTIPGVEGEYFISVTVNDSHGGTFTATRIITRSSSSVYINTVDHFASWIGNMNIYEVNSYGWNYNGGTFRNVSSMLDKLAALGVNAIWFTPIFDSDGDGMGYWTVDYYKIAPGLGTLADFKSLVTAAHSRGIRIILDLVFSSTNKKHPFFQDCLANKAASPYANYYIWSGTPGASGYFYLYDWDYLPFLNVANPDVARYLQEVAEYWMTETSVDGFRCDVAWGIEQKSNTFWPNMAARLKNIKPDLFLLAEGPAKPVPGSYESTPSALHNKSILFDDRFNSAYDWELRGWTEDKGLPGILTGKSTIEDLHSIVSEPYPDRALVMRFIENHDVNRAASLYGLDKSKIAHALVFTIPGIPLIYGGAETGQTSRSSGRGPDNPLLESWFTTLIHMRRNYIANDATLIRLPNTDPAGVYSYCTQSANGNRVITLLNLRNSTVNINLNLSSLSGFSTSGASLTNIFTAGKTEVAGSQAAAFPVSLAPYEARILVAGANLNLIRNGTFDAGMTNWTTYINTASATASGAVTNGRFRMTITRAGTQGWHIQLIQQGIRLEQNKTYELSFQASADAARSIEVSLGQDGGSFNTYYRDAINLTTALTTFTRTFRMSSATDAGARFVVDMGTSDIDVNLDSFVLTLKEGSSGTHDLFAVDPVTVTVYPNPAQDYINIRFSQPGTYTIRIYSLTGQLMQAHNIEGDHLTVPANLLPKGMYMVKWAQLNQTDNEDQSRLIITL